MPLLWIVHREPRIRAAIARLAGASDDAVVGGPGDPLFDAAPAPDVVLLGLAGDFEAELEFARRASSRHRGFAWILLVERRRADSVARLFDTLPARVVVYPPDPHALRALIREAALRRDGPDPLPLSQRPAREELSSRFSRWFSDLELPQVLRALDPRLADVPLLIRGEPGTGRATLVRYVHAFGGTAGGQLVQLSCTESTGVDQLRRELAAASRSPRTPSGCTLWLEDVDRLSRSVQRVVRGWIEHGAPEDTVRCARPRWVGTASDDDDVDPGLRRALSGLTIRIPPLRERPRLVPNLANGAAAAWCDLRGQRPRRFGEHALAVLEEYPWPGNLQELESVVVQSLSSSTADPLGVEDLQMDGVPFAPLDASNVGVWLGSDDFEEIEDEEPPWELAPPRPLRAVRQPVTAPTRAGAEAAETAPTEAGAEAAETAPGEQGAQAPETIPSREGARAPEAAPGEAAQEPLTAGAGEAAQRPETAGIGEVAQQPLTAGAGEAAQEPLTAGAGEAAQRPETAGIGEAPQQPETAGIGEAAQQPPTAGAAAGRQPSEPKPVAPAPDPLLRRLAAALDHEVRNPLATIRSFTDLLPERYADTGFRARFSRLVTEGIERVDQVLQRLQRLATLAPPDRKVVDVSGLLEEVLDLRRDRIRARNLLVLKELDTSHPNALCDPEQIRFAFEALVDKSLDLLPDRGDLYLASRYDPTGLRGTPSVRVLLRLQGPRSGSAAEGLSEAENALEFAVAEAIVRAQGGALATQAGDAGETLLILDLPAPPRIG